jgi:predicted phage tail protein
MEVNQTPAELKNALNLMWHPHPITPLADRQHISIPVEKGSTVRQILINSGLDTSQPIVISLDDKLLTVEEWDSVCPEYGQILNVQATVMDGGGGGSDPLRIVLLIVVVIAAAYTGGAVGALYGAAWGAAAGAAVGIAGSLIVNAIVPARLASTDYSSSNGTASAASPTYSLSGGTNQNRLYQPMPVVMGSHKYFPDNAARPYTEYQGTDQFLYQVYNLGPSRMSLSNWQIGTTPIESYTNWSWRYPLQDGKIYDFPGNVDSIAGANLTKAAGWISRTTSENTYRVGIDVEGILYYANDAGGLDNTSVQLRVEYRPHGSSIWLAPSNIVTQGSGFASGHYSTYNVSVEVGGYYDEEGNYYPFYETQSRTDFVTGGNAVIVSGNSQTAKRATLFFDVPVGQYDVRVIRDTDDSTNSRLQNNTGWSTMRSYQIDNGNYAGQNRRGLVIKASEQLNGVIQQLSVSASAQAYYYNGYAWVYGETSNPAKWFMDFAIGRRDQSGKLLYGVGLDQSQIDLAALFAWSNFCELQGLTFNAVLDGVQSAADVLSMISRCGFASPTWASGKLGVVWDQVNASPVAAFGMSNIIKGSFQVSYITEQLADEIVVSFVNPNKDWAQDQVRVMTPGTTSPKRSTTIDLLGCTNQAMAGKFANYMAAQQFYRTRRIQWDTDFEGFTCTRGDVVLLSHDLTQWDYSGRVVSISGSTIKLDRSVPRNGSIEHLTLKKPDGTMATYSVSASSTESDTLTILGFPVLEAGYDAVDHIWFFSPTATPGKKVKILSVQPSSESRLTVVATDESPEFYAAWGGTFATPQPSTRLPEQPIAVDNLTILARTAIVNGYAVNRAAISWTKRSGTQYCRVRVYVNGNIVREVAQCLVDGIEVDVSGSGSLYVEITPFGLTGTGTTVTETLVLPSLDLPQPPASLTLLAGETGKSATLTWPVVAGATSYVIEIWSSGAKKRTVNVGNTRSYVYSVDEAATDGGPFRSYEARVYSVSAGGQSATYAEAAFNNPQIAQLQNATIEPLPNSLWFTYTKPTESDFEGVLVWISKSSSFTPSDATLVFEGVDTWITINADAEGNPLESGVTYYLYAAGYDSFGRDNLALTNKLSTNILSPAWGLIQGDIETNLLEAGLQARIDLIDAEDTTAGSVNARIKSEATTRQTADTALASSIDTVQTTVNGHTSSIQTNATSIDGINSKYTVKIDNNGYITGYGLISSGNNGTPASEFAVVADRFSLSPTASSPTANSKSPFFVLTAPQVINGVTVPAGSYIKSAFIANATIGTAQIQDAAISDAKIANLDASKINAGYLAAARIQAGSLDAKIANISAAVITSGTIGTARIADAAITSAKIGDLQVNTLKIADNAVTVPVMAYSPSQVWGNDGWQQANSVVISNTSSVSMPVVGFVTCTVYWSGTGTITVSHQLVSDEYLSGPLASIGGSNTAINSLVSLAFSDTIPAYTTRTYTHNWYGTGSFKTAINYKRLIVLGTKK